MRKSQLLSGDKLAGCWTLLDPNFRRPRPAGELRENGSGSWCGGKLVSVLALLRHGRKRIGANEETKAVYRGQSNWAVLGGVHLDLEAACAWCDQQQAEINKDTD